MNINDGKWCISRNGEDYDNDFFDTKEEAIEYATDNDDYNCNETFFVGKAEFFKPKIDADDIIDRISDDAYDNYGEWAEAYLHNINTVQKSELQYKLQSVFNKWMKKYSLDPVFFRIVEYYKFNVEVDE